MKRRLGFGFLLMGFSFTVTQGLLIRELLVAFLGNELSIGLILGSWLVLEAVGSGILGRLADRWRATATSFAVLQVLFALFLPLCLYAVYNSRRIVGAIPGEGVGLAPVFYASFLILTPLAVIDGAMFAFGCRAYAALTGSETLSIGRVYVYEALGALIGGILFTFALTPYLYSLQIVWVVAWLNLLSAVLILQWRSSDRSSVIMRGVGALVILLTAVCGLVLSMNGKEIQHWASRKQWAGGNVVFSENSAYGNVAVIQRGEQYTFFADGIPILTAPVPDVVLSEETVHLPLLFVPAPRQALVLSGGVGGVLHELEKYELDRIDYAELDPLLIQAVNRFPTSLTTSELSDPRLSVAHVDGRLLVRREIWGSIPRPEQGYDLIVVNLPYPSTLQLNRFYTVEFFQMVRELLADRGVVVIGCPGSLVYLSSELRDLNTTIYHTLQQAIPYIRPIPDDHMLWLASTSDAVLTTRVEELVQRWGQRDLETQLITPSHLRLKLGQRRLDWFWTALRGDASGDEVGESEPMSKHVNRDLYPVGLYRGLAYWNALFSPRLMQVIEAAGQFRLWMWGLVIVGAVAAALALARHNTRGRRAIVFIAIATTGFSGMAADLIIIFAFQTLYGHVYQWVVLLITAFMAGLSLGAWVMMRRSMRPGRALLSLLKLELAMVLYWVFSPLALTVLYSNVAHPAIYSAILGALLLLNVVAGFLVGSEFPVASRLWLAERQTVGSTAGALYAGDLIGAFGGAILVSVLLVPVLGIVETCILVAMLKLGSLALVATLTRHT